MRRSSWAAAGLYLAGIGLVAGPISAQDMATPPAQETPVADAGKADAAATAADTPAPIQGTLQTGQAPARAKMSLAEKAAAVTGAVAAGVVAFKGLSALFKSKKPAEPTPPAN